MAYLEELLPVRRDEVTFTTQDVVNKAFNKNFRVK